MTKLQVIDKIGFEDGTFVELNDLPDAIRAEVEQYNEWTQQLAGVNGQIEAFTKQQRQLTYARTAAYNIITQAVLEFQQTTKETTDETPAQSTVESNDFLDSQAPQ